jgi:WD40 repeat protein
MGVKSVKNVWSVIQLGRSRRSSISAVEFHPSGNLAAVGSIDGRIRIYSSNYSKAV